MLNPEAEQSIPLTRAVCAFINRIEREAESPSPDNLVRIGKAVGIRVRHLVEGF